MKLREEFKNSSYDAGLADAEAGHDPDWERYDDDLDYAAGYDSYELELDNSNMNRYEAGYKGKTMKVTKRQLKRIIKEEKRKLLNEGVMISDVFAQAAAALKARDGDALERLVRSMDGLMMAAEEHDAYREALEAMTEAAYELEQHEEGY